MLSAKRYEGMKTILTQNDLAFYETFKTESFSALGDYEIIELLEFNLDKAKIEHLFELRKQKKFIIYNLSFDLAKIELEAVDVLIENLNTSEGLHDIFHLEVLANVLLQDTKVNYIEIILDKFTKNLKAEIPLRFRFKAPETDYLNNFLGENIKKIVKVMHENPRVLELTLKFCNLKQNLRLVVSEICTLKSLKYLDFSYNELGKFSAAEILEVIPVFWQQLTDLTTIKICGNQLWRFGSEFLKKISETFLENKKLVNVFLISDRDLALNKDTIMKWYKIDRYELVKVLLMLMPKNNIIEFPNIAYDFNEKEWIELLQDYLEKHPRTFSYKVKSWQNEYPVLREYFRLQSFIAPLTDRFPGSTIQISEPPLTMTSINFIQQKLSEVSSSEKLKLELIVSEKSELELATFVNSLSFTGNCSLGFITNVKDPLRAKRISTVFSLIENSAINNFIFEKVELGSCDATDVIGLLQNMVKKSKGITFDFSGNALHLLGQDVILKMIEPLHQLSDKSIVVLYHNDIFSLGAEFTVKFLKALDLQNRLNNTKLFKFINANDLQLALKNAHSCTLEDKKCLIELLLKSILRSYLIAIESWNHYVKRINTPLISLPFPLSGNDLVECLSDCFRNQATEVNARFIFPMVVASTDLSEADKFRVLEVMLDSGLGILYDQGLQLSVAYRIKLFLRSCLLDPENLEEIQDFTFETETALAAKVLATLLIGSSSIDETGKVQIHLGVNYSKFFECYRGVGKSLLSGLSQEIWGDEGFSEVCLEILDKIFKPQDSDKTTEPVDVIEAFHAFKMIGWFTWLLGSIISDEKLNKEFQHNREWISVSAKVFKETLKLANPKMRYLMSQAYFELIRKDQIELYKQLIAGFSLEASLLAIPLSLMLLKEIDHSNDDVLRQMKTLLLQINHYKFEGANFRVLLDTLLCLADDLSIRVACKLKLLTRIFTKNISWENMEKPVLELAPEFSCSSLAFSKDTTTLVLLAKLFEMNKADTLKYDGLLRERNKLYKKALLADPDFVIKTKQNRLPISHEITKVEEQICALEQDFSNALSMRVMMINQVLRIISTHSSEAFKKFVESRLPSRLITTRECRKLMADLQGQLVCFFKTDESKLKVAALQELQGLTLVKQLPDIVNSSDLNFSESCKSVTQKIFCLTTEQLQYYDATFGQQDDARALLIYYAKIKSIVSHESVKMLELFKDFVAAVLSENSVKFYKKRYDVSTNCHLKTVFQNNLLLCQGWKDTYEKDLQSFAAEHNITYKEYIPDFKAFVERKIFKHRHVDPKHFPLLKQFLETTDATEQVQLQHEAMLLAANAVFSPSHAKVQFELIKLLSLQLNTEEEVLSRYEQHFSILKKIERLVSVSEISVPFLQDLNGLINGLKSNIKPSKKQDWTGWKAVKTDNYWHLFMSGTHVGGSCQNVYGDPNLNKCLMAIVMDGKNQLLAILDNNNQIVGRCILRILIDPKKSSAVLYREEIYPETLRKELVEVLYVLARLEAKKLGLPLLASDGTMESFNYNDPICSLYSPALYEYVDANYKIEEAGVFEIKNAQLDFSPTLLTDDQKFQENLPRVLTAFENYKDKVPSSFPKACSDPSEYNAALLKL